MTVCWVKDLQRRASLLALGGHCRRGWGLESALRQQGHSRDGVSRVGRTIFHSLCDSVMKTGQKWLQWGQGTEPRLGGHSGAGKVEIACSEFSDCVLGR